jgi:uncharacterized membrane protein
MKLKTASTERTLNWLPWLIAAAISVIAVAHLAYILAFASEGLSNSQERWGQYGDFIGGVTNPLLSFFALIALLATLLMQRRQLDLAHEQLAVSRQELQETRVELSLARQAAQEQVAHMKREARKNDIYRTIQVLETRLERIYREPIQLLLHGPPAQWQLYLLFAHASDSTLKRVPRIDWDPPPEWETEVLKTKATLTQLHITLVKFEFLLTSLVELDNSDELLLYYEPTLSHLEGKLKKLGYLPESDEVAISWRRQARRELRERRRSDA